MRINLAIDPSIRSGTTAAYVPLGGATLSVTTDYAFYGENALVISKDDTNGSGVAIAQPIPVVAGMNHAFSWYTRLPIEIPAEEGAQLVMEIDWLNSVGTVLETDISATLVMDDDSTWYRIGGVWTAPVGATFAVARLIQPLAGTAGATIIVDALLVERADYIGGYFDDLPQAKKNQIVSTALTPVPQVINGVRLGADISLNGLVFNTIDEDDTVWVITGMDGWWGQTAPELPDIPRGTEDGSYDVEGRATARTIALSGFFIPKDTEASLSKSIDRLVLAMNLVRQGGWLHANEAPTKAAYVRLSGKPMIQTVNARGRTAFQIILRAGDPVKYHWDDADADGYTNLFFEAADVIGSVDNIGTATVAGLFTIEGPAGVGTRIYNATTDETMTLQEPLRGAGLVADAYEVESLNGVATIYTTAAHSLRVGDEVALLNMVIPFSETDETRIITAVSEVFPYSISFAIDTDDIDLMTTNGQIRLVNNDILVVDTYNRSVTYNGEISGHRNKLTTLTDWIHFGPGNNIIEFFDDVTEVEVVSKQLTSNVVTLTTEDAHYLIPGETIEVALPETVALSKKSLTSNVVTLTMTTPHGFSVGDTINVQSIEMSKVVTKSRTSNVVSLTTEVPHGVAVSDSVQVALPTTAVPNAKSLSSNVATLGFQHGHGLSAGDAITVALPTAATIINKQLTANQATLTTAAPHNFSVGDSITVALPADATVTGKARSGSQVVITTSAPHGFAVNDQVVMALPTYFNLTGTRSISGTTNLATLTTDAPHGFSVGDKLTISTTIVTSRLVTNRSATTTHCTITCGTHNWAVGEKIVVGSVDARFNGTFYITGVTGTTVTYANAGAAVSSTASSGDVENYTLWLYYGGTKYIETIPSSTTFTFRAWDQAVDTTSSGTTGTVSDLTNVSDNGTKTVVSITPTTFAYNF